MKIGIVGSGISGSVAAYRLSSQHDVTVFEANNYVGGHTNTIDVSENEKTFGVDTGFIVFNDRTYPGFITLLEELGVPFQKTGMTFSVKCEGTGLEYRGANLNGIFAQRSNLLRPRFLRMLYDLVRLKKVATPIFEDEAERETVAEFLERNKFSQAFIEDYFLPMGAAIWSCPFEKFAAFPMRFIAEFYKNHGLLGVTDRPQWFVISGGSREYSKKLTASFRDRIQLNSAVTGVHRNSESVMVQVNNGELVEFDHVIFACHSDQALRILGSGATETEHEILSAFPYQKNIATLHTQSDVLPKNKRAWAAWNYFKPKQESTNATVTYCMNILQSLETEKTYCVTLNDEGRIRDENILRQFVYHHPTFDLQRRKMQLRHHELIGPNRTSFCGAYWGNGFHEDGVQSALAVVDALSTSRPVPEVALA